MHGAKKGVLESSEDSIILGGSMESGPAEGHYPELQLSLRSGFHRGRIIWLFVKASLA
jgi:hypothetical protein